MDADRPAHVLIVEDNALVSGALRVLFESTGRRVSVAGTVAEAVAVGREAPELMLLDLTLPDGDGFAVLERLGADAASRPRTIVALTGHDDPALSERCRAMGCAEVLLKPVPARELLRRADEWLA